MPSPTTQKVGPGPCPECAETIIFRLSSGGKLTHRCDYCDSSGYAEPGGKAYAARMARIKKTAPEGSNDPAPKAPAPPPQDTPPTHANPPPKAKVNSVFSLADLT